MSEKTDNIKNQIEDVKQKTIADMRLLGTYKDEFDDMITTYAQVKVQYDQIFERFLNSGMASQVKSSGGAKKAPLVAQLEELRKQMASLSDRLGLNPQALDRIKNQATVKAKTGLEAALEKIADRIG